MDDSIQITYNKTTDTFCISAHDVRRTFPATPESLLRIYRILRWEPSCRRTTLPPDLITNDSNIRPRLFTTRGRELTQGKLPPLTLADLDLS